MKQEDLSLNSPKARHWYVTNRMRLIKETTQSEGQLAQKMAELVVYMARRRNIERLRTFFTVEEEKESSRYCQNSFFCYEEIQEGKDIADLFEALENIK